MIDRLLFTIKGVREMLMRCTLFSLITGALLMGQAFCLTSALVNLWYNQPLFDQIPLLIGFFICLVARQFVDNAQDRGSLPANATILLKVIYTSFIFEAFNNTSWRVIVWKIRLLAF